VVWYSAGVSRTAIVTSASAIDDSGQRAAGVGGALQQGRHPSAPPHVQPGHRQRRDRGHQRAERAEASEVPVLVSSSLVSTVDELPTASQ
jgi:hypothetical protein